MSNDVVVKSIGDYDKIVDSPDEELGSEASKEEEEVASNDGEEETRSEEERQPMSQEAVEQRKNQVADQLVTEIGISKKDAKTFVSQATKEVDISDSKMFVRVFEDTLKIYKYNEIANELVDELGISKKDAIDCVNNAKTKLHQLYYTVDDMCGPVGGSPGNCQLFKFALNMKEYETYITSHSDIGLVTMGFMFNARRYPNRSSSTWFVRSLCFLLLCVQVVTPCLLFGIKVREFLDRNYEKSFCPSGADGITRAVAFFVGTLYVTRVNFVLGQRSAEASDPCIKTKFGKEGGKLQRFVWRDRFMNSSYEAIVFAMNLWIVFVTVNGFDMVLNSLALEFLANLDNEAKESYMYLYPPNASTIFAYMDANNDLPPGKEGEENDMPPENEGEENEVTKKKPKGTPAPLDIIIIVVFCFACLYIFFSWFHLPICTPGSDNSKQKKEQ